MYMSNYNIRFSRAINGFDQQEVNAVTMELQKQIIDLKQQNDELSKTISAYENKTKEITDNAKELQDERAKESLRVTTLMSNAMKMAEQTEFEAECRAEEVLNNSNKEAARIIETAKKEADETRAKAQTDFMSARSALNTLEECVQFVRKNNDNYITKANAQLCAIDALLGDAKGKIAAATPTAFTFSEDKDEQVQDTYEDFVQNIKIAEK